MKVASMQPSRAMSMAGIAMLTGGWPSHILAGRFGVMKMGSRFWGIPFLVGLILLGQFINRAALTLSRAGDSGYVLPPTIWVIGGCALLYIVLELIALGIENKGGGYT